MELRWVPACKISNRFGSVVYKVEKESPPRCFESLPTFRSVVMLYQDEVFPPCRSSSRSCVFTPVLRPCNRVFVRSVPHKVPRILPCIAYASDVHTLYRYHFTYPTQPCRCDTDDGDLKVSFDSGRDHASMTSVVRGFLANIWCGR